MASEATIARNSGGSSSNPKNAVRSAGGTGETVRLANGQVWERQRKVTASTTPQSYGRQKAQDFNEAVRRAAYGEGPVNMRGQETTVNNRRDAARQVAKYQELSRNPTLKNIKAAARIYNGLEQNNYHTELRSARKGATSKDISRTLQSELNRDATRRRNQQRARRMARRSQQ